MSTISLSATRTLSYSHVMCYVTSTSALLFSTENDNYLPPKRIGWHQRSYDSSTCRHWGIGTEITLHRYEVRTMAGNYERTFLITFVGSVLPTMHMWHLEKPLFVSSAVYSMFSSNDALSLLFLLWRIPHV